MPTKQQVVYKVVRRLPSTALGSMMWDSLPADLCCLYRLDVWTKAPDGTKLLAFDTLETAFNFRRDFPGDEDIEILRVYGRGVRTPDKIEIPDLTSLQYDTMETFKVACPYILDQIRRWWRDPGEMLVIRGRIPRMWRLDRGTVICSAVRPISIVTESEIEAELQ